MSRARRESCSPRGRAPAQLLSEVGLRALARIESAGWRVVALQQVSGRGSVTMSRPNGPTVTLASDHPDRAVDELASHVRSAPEVP